jgi:hypothetical protein
MPSVKYLTFGKIPDLLYLHLLISTTLTNTISMTSKTSIVKDHVATGDYHHALKIAKTFRIGLTRDEQRAIQYAYECMVHADSYRQLGRDIDETISQGVKVLQEHFV